MRDLKATPAATDGVTLKVLSYNIAKGFSPTRLKLVLKQIKTAIQAVHADLVLLQEVVGHHTSPKRLVDDWPDASQFEYLADSIWSHYAYGRNSAYNSGHHGNAILSKYPILFWEHIDVSKTRFDKKGLLHAILDLPGHATPTHVICIHLGLFEATRRTQTRALCDRIEKAVPRTAPLIIGGDFNDWRQRVGRALEGDLGLTEVFRTTQGKHARSFPNWLPVLKLDRIYTRGFEATATRCLKGPRWRKLSDHAPLYAELKLT
jgi:endonuclease/exonuclease/phosphatase family metal-dependent hydrolase